MKKKGIIPPIEIEGWTVYSCNRHGEPITYEEVNKLIEKAFVSMGYEKVDKQVKTKERWDKETGCNKCTYYSKKGKKWVNTKGLCFTRKEKVKYEM